MSLLTDLAILLNVDAIALKLPVESKKRALECISELAAKAYGMDADIIYEHLLARERMGATGLGQGLAIPHCRLDDLLSPIFVIVTLAEPIDYGAQDQQPVDVLWTLLVPSSAQETHLQALAAIAHFLRQDNLTHALRQASDASAVYQLIEANLCLPPT